MLRTVQRMEQRRGAFLHLRIDPDVKAQFVERCGERGLTITWVVERAIEEFLAGRWDPMARR